MPVMHIKPGRADPVKKPAHYTYGRYEAIDVIEELTAGASGPEGFLLGNVLKYLWRYRRKNGLEDLQKAMWYLDRLVQRGSDTAASPEKATGEAEEMDGTRADTAILDVAPGEIPIRDNRPVFGETTTWAAAKLTGQKGEFFYKLDGARTTGTLLRIEKGGTSDPYIASIPVKAGGRAWDIVMPYTFFSPLNPEKTTGEGEE